VGGTAGVAFEGVNVEHQSNHGLKLLAVLTVYFSVEASIDFLREYRHIPSPEGGFEM
jgi:hypothetical protein